MTKLWVRLSEASKLLDYSMSELLKCPPVTIIRHPGRRPRVRMADIEAYVNGKKSARSSIYKEVQS
jgi:hypothetical protein